MTPTKEQLIAWVAQADAYATSQTSDFQEHGEILSERFATLAMSAGREQGLKDAAAKVRAILADCEARDIDDPALEQVAQDIEQLRASA